MCNFLLLLEKSKEKVKVNILHRTWKQSTIRFVVSIFPIVNIFCSCFLSIFQFVCSSCNNEHPMFCSLKLFLLFWVVNVDILPMKLLLDNTYFDTYKLKLFSLYYNVFYPFSLFLPVTVPLTILFRYALIKIRFLFSIQHNRGCILNEISFHPKNS